jgi:hypothetical protein
MWRLAAIVLAAGLTLLPRTAGAYSVLTHEAIIDASWERGIATILERRFHPSADALAQARAYAYGGCVLPDMGYYPLSSRTFSDLTHYVRAGDFVAALIRDAADVNELAFALGVLAHYTADTNGHAIAINPSTSLLFPKLARKFGRPITYEDSPSSHLRTEFAFDVVQVARGAYLPQSYRDFIGFKVATPVLERAFLETYGLELRDVFANLDLSIGTFRWSVSTLLPALTKAAWDIKKHDVEKLAPGTTPDNVLFRYPRAEYEADWGTDYRRPAFHHRVLGFLIRIVPKVGPFKPLAF